MNDVVGSLEETGVIHGVWGLSLSPMVVKIETVNCTLKIPMPIFKRFAEWYLEDQNELL
jgi:hypothetical protein